MAENYGASYTCLVLESQYDCDCGGCLCGMDPPMPTPSFTASPSTSLLEDRLASYYDDCYDPSGATCTCFESIGFDGESLTGTILSALSACTDVTSL